MCRSSHTMLFQQVQNSRQNSNIACVRFIIVHAQMPHFLVTLYFALASSKSFQTGCRCLSFLRYKVSHSNQAPMFSFPPFTFTAISRLALLQEIRLFPLIHFSHQDIFFDPILYLTEYIMPYVVISKQFSIDSFLDWEGHLWDFCLSHSSIITCLFPPPLPLL